MKCASSAAGLVSSNLPFLLHQKPKRPKGRCLRLPSPFYNRGVGVVEPAIQDTTRLVSSNLRSKTGQDTTVRTCQEKTRQDSEIRRGVVVVEPGRRKQLKLHTICQEKKTQTPPNLRFTTRQDKTVRTCQEKTAQTTNRRICKEMKNLPRQDTTARRVLACQAARETGSPGPPTTTSELFTPVSRMMIYPAFSKQG